VVQAKFFTALPGYLSIKENAVAMTPENMNAEQELSNEPNGSVSEERDLSQPRSDVSLPIVFEKTISLLAERLVVDRRKRKVGEVILRKEIETRMVEVPIRREKLIVEQVSPEYEQLAVIDLGQASTEQDVLEVTDNLLPKTVSSEFTSAHAAIQFLEAIADQPNPGLQRVQVSIISEDAALQAAYQQWLEQHAPES
jgi:Domain of unknown function (DUF2382)